ncbi:MAG: hypothetical protein U9R17_12105 [Thermodesulfobacteriota bacterium]|nr:hypothetical protein [Thermodesulfobacteriota bacterium]
MTKPISLSTWTVIFTLSLLLFLPLASFSSGPVAPPFEGALITNTTNINVVGTFQENENFSHDQTGGAEVTIEIEGELIYQSPMDQAKTSYTDEVRSTNGHTMFVKDFSFNTHPGDGNPNIETERAIGFETIPGFTAGTIQSKEKGAVSICHSLGFNDCVEPTEQGDLICIKENSKYLGIAGGSAFFASNLSAHTETELTVTSTPSVHHAVDANGEGRAESELLFIQTEGSVAITDDCANMDCPGRGGSHMVVFNEKTSADGKFSAFHKDLYAGVVEQNQAPQSSFFSGLITLDSLCPFVP